MTINSVEKNLENDKVKNENGNKLLQLPQSFK
jgi:hypothetical protein